MKRTPLVVAAAVVALVITTAPLAGGVPIVAKPLGVGTIATPTTLKVKPGAMVVEAITVNPGGSFGWHTHGSPVAVVVTGGTLTVFDPSVGACKPFKVSKGQSFFEPANHVHLARNDGTKPATLYATYLGIPKGAQANHAAPEPATCNA